MNQELEFENSMDQYGFPSGGFVRGVGIRIEWQNGPLGRGDDRKEPNGAFVEGVISAVLQRLQHYQVSSFKCAENEFAIAGLEGALRSLEARTKERDLRKVEGTHVV